MILKELRLSHFGKFQEKEVSLKPGLNIVYGKNEAGKSTMHSFIRGMLFGIERQRGRASKDDVYTKYLPWKSNGLYEGSMDIIAGNKEYRILRNFQKNNREFRILDLTTGREVELVHKDIADIIPGLTESLYRNTVSIEQLHTGTDDELAKEVRNYMANLSVSKTNEVDVSSALAQLTARRKEIQAKLNLLDTKHLSHQLERKMDELCKVDELNESLLQMEMREKELRERKEAFLKDEVKNRDLNGDKVFAVMEPKFMEYMQLQKDCEETNEQYKELTKSINDLLRVENCHKTIYRDLEEVNQLHEKTHQMQNRIAELRRKEDALIAASRPGKRVAYIIPILIGILLSFIFINTTVGISLCVGVVMTALIYYLVKQARLQGRLKELEQEEVELDRKCIASEAKKRDIYLRNNVTGDSELRYKMQMLKDNQEEFNEYKERRRKVEKEQIQIYSRIEHLEKDIRQFTKSYFDDYVINEDLVHDLEYEVNLRKEAAQKELDEMTREYKETVMKLERVKWELSNYEEFEEELQKEQKLFEEANENRCKLEKDLQAILLAIEGIEALSIDIHDSFGDQINKRLSYIVEKVTNGRYKAVKMDETLNIKVLRDYDYVSFEKLSAGAIAEVYLALRITIADLLNGTKTLPLILDDAFVLYDDERLEATLRELSHIADRQILIFTCHDREKEILDRLQLDYHYVNLSENPSQVQKSGTYQA